MREERTFNNKEHANNWFKYMSKHYSDKYTALSIGYNLIHKQWEGTIVWKTS